MKKNIEKKYDDSSTIIKEAFLLKEVDLAIEKLKNGEYVSNKTLDKLANSYKQQKLYDIGSAYWQIRDLFSVDNPEIKKDLGKLTPNELLSFDEKIVNLVEIKEIINWWQKAFVDTKTCFFKADKFITEFFKADKSLDNSNLKVKLACVLENKTIGDINTNSYRMPEVKSNSKFGQYTFNNSL